MTASTLYIIGTPLGNLNDVTVRAKEMLTSLKHLFAEDTRELLKLLNLLGISSTGKEIFSYALHNMKGSTGRALSLLASGHDVGLASDRGMPCISDPGFLLVQEARGKGYPVIPVPGPSSVTTALSVSGLPADRFLFVGFLPDKKKEREALYKNMKACCLPVCLFESPFRIRKTLEELGREFPAGRVFVTREMTKVFETYTWLNLGDLEGFEAMERGEYTLVVDVGGVEAPVEDAGGWEAEIRLRLASDKEWAKMVAARYTLSSKLVYDSLQRAKDNVKKSSHLSD